MGIFAFKSKETERKLSKKLGHQPPPPPQTPPGTKALAWHPLHPPGPTQKLKQLETWPDPRSVLVPAPATGVLPAGHDAHGKASWTVALGGKVSGGGQDSHRRDRQNGMELCVVLVSLAPLELDPPGAPASTCSHRPGGSEKGPAPAVLNIASFLSCFSPGSSDKIDKRNDKMKRRGSSNRGRRNFETWKKKIPQPSPTEKQKLNVVSHSALLSSSPGTPAGPPKQPSFLRALGRGLGGRSCAPAAKQKATCKTDSAMQRAERKKGCSRTSSPSHPGLPSGEGTSSPNKSTSTVLRGPVPHPCPSWGNPTLSWGQSSTRELRGLAWEDGGCRSRGRSPPDPTQPSLTACSGGGEAGPPLSPPAPPFG